MNVKLLLWYAALAALIWSAFSTAIGIGIVAGVLLNVLGEWLAAVGALMIIKSMLTLYYTYNWFTAGVDDEA